MFPLGDDNEGRRSLPVVTFGLIALNVIFFLVELNGGDAFIRQWAFIPRRFGADPAGDAHTVFSAMFMHGGWLHLGGNMLYLWIFGDKVEDAFGPDQVPSLLPRVRDSGDICPVCRHTELQHSQCGRLRRHRRCARRVFASVSHARVRVLMGNQIVAMPALFVLGLWIVLQVFSGVGSIANTAQTVDTGGVAYMADVGGFVAGFVLTFFVIDPAPAEASRRLPFRFGRSPAV